MSLWSDEDDEDPLPIILPSNRRKSVFVRGYNPDNESDNHLAQQFHIPDFHPKSEEVKKKLENSIKDNLLFRELDPEQLMGSIDAMNKVTVRKGDEIIKQGEDGDFFYVIYDGEYEAHVTTDDGADLIMQTYSQNGSFGELALMYNQPRQATVKATTNGSLYALHRDMFQKIVLKSAHVKRKLYGELINKVSLFENLTGEEKIKIADVLNTIVFTDGESIIKQGAIADGMYFVISGSVKITKHNGEHEIVVKVINGGEYFGELALLKNKPRAANGYANGLTKVAFLAAEAFERLMGPCLKLMQTNADDYL